MNATWFKKLWVLLIFCTPFFLSCKKTNNEQVSKTKVLVILGSSTAEGVGAEPRDSSWANKLRFQLIGDRIDAKMINLALAGYKTFNVLPSSFPTADTNRNVDRALSYKPDLIILSLPSNDFAGGYPDSVILNNFKIIVKKITDANVSLILLSTQPRNFSDLTLRKRVAFFNDSLQSTFTDHFLNVYPDLATHDYKINTTYAFGDGVHINNKGHNLIYQKLARNNVFKYVFY